MACGAPGTERRVACLTAKGLDALGVTMLAIANQRVDLGIGDPEVRALQVGTGKALGVHPLGRSPPAFHLAPRAYRCWCGPCTRRGSGAESTGGAIVRGAGFEETLHRGVLDLSS